MHPHAACESPKGIPPISYGHSQKCRTLRLNAQEFPSAPLSMILWKQMPLISIHSVQHTFIKHLLSANRYAKYWRHNEPTQRTHCSIWEMKRKSVNFSMIQQVASNLLRVSLDPTPQVFYIDYKYIRGKGAGGRACGAGASLPLLPGPLSLGPFVKKRIRILKMKIQQQKAINATKVLESWRDLTVAESGKASYRKNAGFCVCFF